MPSRAFIVFDAFGDFGLHFIRVLMPSRAFIVFDGEYDELERNRRTTDES